LLKSNLQLKQFVTGIITLSLSVGYAFSQSNESKLSSKLLYSEGNTIQNQILVYDDGICSYLYQILKPISQTEIDENSINAKGFTLLNNKFEQTKATISDAMQSCLNTPINIQTGSIGFISNNHFAQPLVLSGISGEIRSNSNYYPQFLYESSDYGSIDLTGDTTNSSIHFRNIRNKSIQVLSIFFNADTATIDIWSSKIDQLFISGNKAKFLNIYFGQNTLGFVRISNEGFHSQPKKVRLGASISSKIILPSSLPQI